MKKYVKFLSVVLSVIILLPAIPLAGNAYSYEYKATEGAYTYVVNDGEAYIEDVDESISGDIVIPSILGGFPVTKIMAEAFSFCMDITDVTIPDSVTYIDMFAFITNGFETLKIPASVVEIGREENGALAAPCVGGKFKKYIVDENNPYFYSDENGVLYNKDKTVLISYPSARAAESFIIPDGVVELAEASFAFTSALKKVIMPNSIKGMNSAFYCSLIEDVVLSENCWGYLLGYCGFSYCPLLKEVSIPASFKNVNYTFVECYSLKKIIINGTNTKIDEMIFYSGYGNTKEDREEIAKYYAEFIYEKFCNGNREYGDALERKIYDTFPKNENPDYSTYSIYCYKGSSAEEYAIENNIEYFYLCDEHIPETIPGVEATCTEAGLTEGAKCSACGEILTVQVAIPASHAYENGTCSRCGDIEIIASGAYGDNLTWTLTVDGTLTISGSGDMYEFSHPDEIPWNDYREKICKVIFDGKITSIALGAFDNCINLVDANIPDSVLTIGTCAFANCINLPEIIIPDSVTTIGYCAFAGCDSLTSVTIPASVTLIVERPFDSCLKLTEIYVDENNQNYSSDSFGVLFDKEKTSLISYPDANPRTSYTIPESVTNIGFYSLWACKNLKVLGIPASVTVIETNAISYCDNLTDIYYSGTQEEWNKIVVYDEALDSNNSLKNATVHYNSCIESLSEDHIYNKVVTAPTCTERGYTAYTCICGDSYIGDYTDIAEHNDADGNGVCDFCDIYIATEDEGKENNCSHMCHQSGFMGFIWKIIKFFWKLFGMNPICECGAYHY